MSSKEKLAFYVFVGLIYLSFASPIYATIIRPPPASYLGGLFKLVFVIFLLIFLVAQLVLLLGQIRNKKSFWKRMNRIGLWIMGGCILGLLLLKLGELVFGSNTWFYKWDVVSRFCEGNRCL